MPIYEYSCSSCGNRFELLRSMSQVAEDATCQECGGWAPRMLSVFVSFSAGSDGELAPIAGGGGGCGGCGPGGCACASLN